MQFTSAEWSALWLSLKASLASLLLILPFGVAIGWVLTRRGMRGRAVVNTVLNLPLVLPPVVTGYLLLLLLGRGTFLGGVLDAIGLPIVFTWRAVVVAVSIVCLPLLVRGVVVAMESVDTRLEAAARTLGAGPFRVFCTVTLPLSYRGILSGMILAFARGLGEFGATIIVAGNIPGRTQTIPLAIFNQIQMGNTGEASRLVILATIVSFGALWVAEHLVLRAGRTAGQV